MESLTLRHVRTIANKRGFSVCLDDTLIYITHNYVEQIESSFDLSDLFRVDPAFARQFTLTRAYYWICGYNMNSTDNDNVLICRGRRHRAFDQTYQCEQLFEYKNMPLLQHEVAV